HTRSKRDWSSDVCSSDLSDAPTEDSRTRPTMVPAETASPTRAAAWGSAWAGAAAANASAEAMAAAISERWMVIDYSGNGQVEPRTEERRGGKSGALGWRR